MIRLAILNDLEAILPVIDDAKALLRLSGSNQWQDPDGYPNRETLIDDINRGILYVYEIENRIMGVAAISHYEELTYRKIYQGKWLTDDNKKVIVIHRLAVKKSNYHNGIAKKFLSFAEMIARSKNLNSIRIDTHRINHPMKELLKKCSYKYCGIIHLNRDSVVDNEREAYEKVIPSVLSNIKGIIFDMDGTMINSMHAWYETGEKIFKATFQDATVDLHKELENMSAWELAYKLFDERHDELGKKIFVEGWYTLMQDCYFNQVQLNPGIQKLLDYFKTKGYKMCVATGTAIALAKPVLAKLEILDYFEFVLTEDMIGKSKHYPDIYTAAAQKMQLEIPQCLVFEDAYHAAKTAFKAGFSVAGVYDDASLRSLDKLKNYCHDFIDSYEEFLNKIQ